MVSRSDALARACDAQMRDAKEARRAAAAEAAAARSAAAEAEARARLASEVGAERRGGDLKAAEYERRLLEVRDRSRVRTRHEAVPSPCGTWKL
jgi:hypothetical protein